MGWFQLQARPHGVQNTPVHTFLQALHTSASKAVSQISVGRDLSNSSFESCSVTSSYAASEPRMGR